MTNETLSLHHSKREIKTYPYNVTETSLSTIRREYEHQFPNNLKSNESQLRVVDMMDDIRSRIEGWNAPTSLNEFERVIEPLVKPVRKEDEEDEAEEKVEEKVSVKKQKSSSASTRPREDCIFMVRGAIPYSQ